MNEQMNMNMNPAAAFLDAMAYGIYVLGATVLVSIHTWGELTCRNDSDVIGVRELDWIRFALLLRFLNFLTKLHADLATHVVQNPMALPFWGMSRSWKLPFIRSEQSYSTGSFKSNAVHLFWRIAVPCAWCSKSRLTAHRASCRGAH